MRTGWKKFAIWVAVISVLLGTVVGSQVMAIKTSEALEQMKEAGKAQLVANVFSKCVKGRIDQKYNEVKGGGGPNSYQRVEPFPGTTNPFIELRKHIPTGSWLEQQVQGKVNNGTIYCEDNNSNILNVFASTMGVDKNAIFCDGKNPGILKLQNQNSKGEWVDVEGECAAGIGNGDLRFVFNDDGAMSHVKKIYNNKKKGNQYMVAWGDRGTFTDDLINYFLYFNDFTTACSNDQFSGDENLLNKTKYFGPIKVPNPKTGKMDKRYYSKDKVTSYNWDSNWINSDGAHTCDAVIKRINDTAPAVKKALDKTEKDDDGTKPDDIVGDITDDANNDGDDNDDGSDVCYDATSPLGWVICPTLSVVGDATTGMYEYLEQHFLTIDASYMKPEDEHGTWKAWDNFRNIANIFFAIALAVIILSQITGFGVSNYGIKKMLPTLIMVAVLSNLSFFLCEVAVDISNIVGFDVKRLLVGIAPEPGGDFGNGSLGTLIGNAFGALGIGTVAITGGIFALVNWRTWIWPLLLVILAAVIGVFFFFLLLGARQAGIIILVALAPIAVICYALPNTKSIFNRWWKMFVGLLLVYPICGALMGGGEFASRLMLANVNDNSGFMFTLVAMLLQSIAFFLVPGVVKSSFAAMGNLGMRLSSFGRSLSRGATGAIRRSEGYKDQVQRSRAANAEKAIKRQAWRDKYGLSVRGRASGWAGRGGIRGAIGNKAKESRDRSQERRINAVAAQSRARQNAAFVAERGLADAERRERDAAMKNYESGYRGDDAFMNDFGAQSRAYEAAIQAVDDNPSNMNARAQLRALQNVLGTSADGQDIIQNVLHRRLAAAQSRGDTTVSAGMIAAGQTLMSDHGGFKSGNRGLNKLSQDLASGKALESDKGRYAATALKDARGRTLTDKAGNQIYENNHYGAAAAAGSAVELAGANDSTLNGMLSSIRNGNMSVGQMEAVYRNAGEAITNDNISVKPENEGLLNDIRQAAYDKLQGQQVGGYTDSTGREFAHTGGNNYQYTDSSGAVHNYTRNSSGDLTEVGGSDVVNNADLTSMSQNYYDDQGRKFVSNGSGTYTYDDGTTKHTYTRNSTTGDFIEVGTGSEVITGNRMKTASDNFGFNYGSGYRDLHAGDTFKVGHSAPATPTKINLPSGWTLTNTGWVDINTGRPLSPMDARRADSIVDHNNQIDNNSH